MPRSTSDGVTKIGTARCTTSRPRAKCTAKYATMERLHRVPPGHGISSNVASPLTPGPMSIRPTPRYVYRARSGHRHISNGLSHKVFSGDRAFGNRRRTDFRLQLGPHLLFVFLTSRSRPE